MIRFTILTSTSLSSLHSIISRLHALRAMETDEKLFSLLPIYTSNIRHTEQAQGAMPWKQLGRWQTSSGILPDRLDSVGNFSLTERSQQQSEFCLIRVKEYSKEGVVQYLPKLVSRPNSVGIVPERSAMPSKANRWRLESLPRVVGMLPKNFVSDKMTSPVGSRVWVSSFQQHLYSNLSRRNLRKLLSRPIEAGMVPDKSSTPFRSMISGEITILSAKQK